MRRFFKLSVILLMYVFLCGKSCDEDGRIRRQQKEAIAEKDSIRKQLEVKILPEESLRMAELSAMQKVRDLADYLQIYSDKSLDSIFRNKSGEMIRDLFTSEDVLFSLRDTKKSSEQSQTLKKFLKNGFGDEFQSALVSFDSIHVYKPMEQSGSESYKGKLIFVQDIKGIISGDTILISHHPVALDINSSRIVKVFGQDAINLWAVSLGDLEKAD
jgi:hypothetical protein